MEIRRLRLLNFRQHADTTLRFGRGITGIIGPNGAGKTTLLEAIAWAIYGVEAVRGTRDTIRRRNAPPRSRVEVELDFALGSHRYRVVRSLQGAELYQDDEPAPIANSPASVKERLLRLLGMNREEFFNTYFTGQKELAVMGQMTATERAQFLSRVLGYEKLRVAQQRLKDRKRILQATHDALKGELADPAQLAVDEELAATRLKAAETTAARVAVVEREAAKALAAARPEAERWEALQQKVLSLEGDLKVADHGAESARAKFTQLDRELAEALAAKTQLDELVPALEPLEALRAERAKLEQDHAAVLNRSSLLARQRELVGQLSRLEEALGTLPDRKKAEQAAKQRGEIEAQVTQAAAELDAARTIWVREKQDAETSRKTLLEQKADVEQQGKRLKAAGADGDCPTCGRPLGKEYKGVMEMLRGQLQEIVDQTRFYEQRIKQLATEPKTLRESKLELAKLEQEKQRRTVAAAQLGQQVAERVRLEAERKERAEQRAALEQEIARQPQGFDEARLADVRGRIGLLEPLALVAAELRSKAARAEELVPRAAAAEQELSQRESRAKALRKEMAQLGWSAERFETARAKLREAQRLVQQAEVTKARAEAELTAALERRAEVARRKEEREKKAGEVQRLADELLLLHELDRALGDLRTELNNTLRPDLSEVASGFLQSLTGGRYDDLELDQDYVPTIREGGEPIRVISGGEEDVANLALRLAISQMIAERAGQPLALLVLDEVFGSLDEERRGAVVDLLRNLADRFPQVILITHVESVREGFDRIIRLSYDVEQQIARATDESRDAAA